MRTLRILLASALFVFPAAADDLLGPGEYLKILNDSKLRYNILSEPSKRPIEQMTCPRRYVTTRVVPKGQEKSLVDWTVKPAAARILEEAETLYEAQKYAEAGEKYKEAIAADADAVIAYFGLGDTLLLGAKDPAAALEQYRKGVALDPTLPLGHFFSATAYMHMGRRADARESIIKALTLHPAYEGVWKIAEVNPGAWQIKPVVRHRFAPPAGYLGGNARDGVDVYGGTDGQWLGYAMCKAVWTNEPQFREKRSGSSPGWSNAEERACVLSQLLATYNQTAAKLEEEAKKRGVEAPKIGEEAIIAALPPLERHLFEVAQEKLLDGYIFFEIIGQHCPIGMSLLNDDSRKQVEQYVRKYVILAND